jgi:hypothetical protein
MGLQSTLKVLESMISNGPEKYEARDNFLQLPPVVSKKEKYLENNTVNILIVLKELIVIRLTKTRE